MTVNKIISSAVRTVIILLAFANALALQSCTGSNKWALPQSASNSAPTANITSPFGGDVFREGSNVIFTGTGSDVDEGALAGTSLVWTSDIDGQIGTGLTFNIATLSRNTHVITLTATDASGAVGTASVTMTVEAAWFDPQWGFRQKITISPAMAPSDQTAFPALIKITDAANPLFGSALSNGDDILFTDEDGVSQLDHEIELYRDTGTEELVAWVNLPNLSSSSDTIIYMYYGYAGAANQEDAAGVWSNSYVGVWHLSESAGQHADSTINGYNSTSVIAAQQGQTAEAMMGGADEFDTMGQVVTIPDPGVNSPLDLIGGIPATFSAWIYVRSTGPCVCQQSGILQKNYSLRLDGVNWSGTGDLTLAGTRVGNWVGISGTGDGIPANTWVYVAYTFEQLPGPSDDLHSIYQDGVLDVSGTIFPWLDAVNVDSAADFRIGMWAGRTFDGFIDEVRISDINRSADWILTEYNNQNDPGTGDALDPGVFTTFAVEEVN